MRLPLATIERQRSADRRSRKPSAYPAKPALRIACIGDSITYGHGIRDRERQSYPARLQQLLGPKYLVRNFGRSGADVLEINNGPYGKTQQHRDALAFQPNVVVCNLGINDVQLLAENKAPFVKDYTRLLQQYAALRSSPKIYLWTDLAPVMPGQKNHQNYLQLKATYAKLLRQVAAQVHGQGLDLRTPLVEHPNWFPDHLHPNAAGAQKIAAVVADAVAAGEPRFAIDVDAQQGNSEAGSSETGGSFETAQAGKFTKLTTPIGDWSAQPGHAEIDGKHANTGRQCLHLMGGKNREVDFSARLLSPGRANQEGGVLSFWAERWTRRDPFEFRVEQRVDDQWVEIYKGDKKVRIGGFLTRVTAPLRETTVRQIRIRSSSPANSGVLIDDVRFAKAEPMKVSAVTVDQPVLPALVGSAASAICCIRVDVTGTSGDAPAVESISLTTVGTTDLSDIAQVELYYNGTQALPSATGHANAFASAESFGDPRPGAETIDFRGRQQLTPGPNYFWVAFRLAHDANIDHQLRAVPQSLILAGGQSQQIQGTIPARGQRMEAALRRRGDDGVHTYRIPGLATTNKETLIGVYDIRRRSGGDLPGDIDVGMSRSTDGGQTWEAMRVIMDMGSAPEWRHDGIGDPSILVDRQTGTIWAAATWSHGNRSWVGSGPGMRPDQTGQFTLVRSDDDGQSWSAPINITAQVKRPEWCFLLQGPGKGITMQDGTLVFPAQFQDTPENKRLPRSTIIFSRDHGETWNIGSGAFEDTTEAQVVELEPGLLMLNWYPLKCQHCIC